MRGLKSVSPFWQINSIELMQHAAAWVRCNGRIPTNVTGRRCRTRSQGFRTGAEQSVSGSAAAGRRLRIGEPISDEAKVAVAQQVHEANTRAKPAAGIVTPTRSVRVTLFGVRKGFMSDGWKSSGQSAVSGNSEGDDGMDVFGPANAV